MNKEFKKILFFILVIANFISLLLFYFSSKSIELYFYTFTAASIFFLIAFIILCHIEINKRELIGIILISTLLKFMLITVEPTSSDDYYRYLWDGKTLVNGINPFQYAPGADELKHLSSDILPSKVSYPEIKTIYFPLSQISFAVSYIISGETAIGLKILLLISDLLITLFLFLLLKKKNIDLKHILIYSLCPLVFYQFFIDAHIDLIGVMFLLLSIFYFDKKLISALLLGASLAVKPTALLAIPIFFFAERQLKTKILWLVIPILFLMITFTPFSIGANPFETLINFSKEWTFNGLVYNIINLFIIDNYTIRIVCLILFSVVYGSILFSKLETMQKLYYALLMLFIFSPIVHPWYLIWLIIPLTLYSQLSGVTYLSLISITFYTVVIYQTTGIWKEYSYILLAEYLPVVILFIYEFYVLKNYKESIKPKLRDI